MSESTADFPRGRRGRVRQDQSVGPAGTRIEVLEPAGHPSGGSHTASASESVSAANTRSGEALMTRTAVSVRLIAGAPVALVDHPRAERPVSTRSSRTSSVTGGRKGVPPPTTTGLRNMRSSSTRPSSIAAAARPAPPIETSWSVASSAAAASSATDASASRALPRRLPRSTVLVATATIPVVATEGQIYGRQLQQAGDYTGPHRDRRARAPPVTGEFRQSLVPLKASPTPRTGS